MPAAARQTALRHHGRLRLDSFGDSGHALAGPSVTRDGAGCGPRAFAMRSTHAPATNRPPWRAHGVGKIAKQF